MHRATAIGVTSGEPQRFVSFIGWYTQSVAYHSDDGTIRNSDILDTTELFSTNDIIGCGLVVGKREVQGETIASERAQRKCMVLDTHIVMRLHHVDEMK